MLPINSNIVSDLQSMAYINFNQHTWIPHQNNLRSSLQCLHRLFHLLYLIRFWNNWKLRVVLMLGGPQPIQTTTNKMKYPNPCLNIILFYYVTILLSLTNVFLVFRILLGEKDLFIYSRFIEPSWRRLSVVF